MSLKDTKKLSKGIANPIKEVVAQCLEVVLDHNLSDGVLKDTPLLGPVLKLYNTGLSVRDRIFYNKLVSFLENIDDTTGEDRSAFWLQFENDEKAKRRLGEQLIIYIDRYDDIDKPILLARAFNALQKGLISYVEMLDLGILITSIKTHYLEQIAGLIYRLSDLDFKELHEREDELPLIYAMEKDGLLLIENKIEMRHVRHEAERKPQVEKTYMATKLAISFIEYIIHDLHEKAGESIRESNKTSDRLLTEGFKRKRLEAEREELLARLAAQPSKAE